MTTSTIIKIERIKYTSKGTYGVIYFNDKKIGVTVEQPWNNNAKGSSCIPKGKYQLQPWDSAKYGKVVVFVNPLLNVFREEKDIPKGTTGRSYCLIHNANYPHELRGCVAVGDKFMTDSSGEPIGVSNSKATLANLRLLWGDRTDLFCEIKDAQ